MRKIIRLTESDLTRIVRRVLKEQETSGIKIPEFDITLLDSRSDRKGRYEINDVKNKIMYYKCGGGHTNRKTDRYEKGQFIGFGDLDVKNLNLKKGFFTYDKENGTITTTETDICGDD